MLGFRQKVLPTCRRFSATSEKMAAPATVTLDNMNPCIKKMEYAVRGPLVIRATAIEKVTAMQKFYKLCTPHFTGDPGWCAKAIQECH